ncbi:ferritin heavy polypeptide-like 17E [Meriones unguiculatus]|uniref:ferritin heavy polypeptide-like 17E n=1 Tax=Meriones unguiculatus TaxID=10047 RepID=UPI000B4EB0A7|nr:ferritin heavy polypeptide-like 17E [Meriones unguiculatus]
MAEASSQVQQNSDLDCEDAVNAHIQLQLYASNVYKSMAFYFDHNDVALGNLKHFFLSKSHNCKAGAEMFVYLQKERGGRVVSHDIGRPEGESWHGALQALECVLRLEKIIHKSLLNLHELAKAENDAQLCHFLEQHCLDAQVQVLKELCDYSANLHQMGALEQNLAENFFGKLSLS